MTRRVAIVGAGVGGLAAAVTLAESGAAVTVYDSAPAPGGLVGALEVGGTPVERFYHHIFRSDDVARRWIEELGLKDRLEFLPAGMGFFRDGRMHRFGTPLSLLLFTPLPLIDRIRLGLRIRALCRRPEAAELDTVTALAWLRARASEAELEVFWIPLLRAKFGQDLDKVSMAWLWARFRARVGDSAGSSERLGYLRGGFQQLAGRLADRAMDLGTEFRMTRHVSGIRIVDGAVAGLITDRDGVAAADAVIWTPTLNALARLVPDLPAAYRDASAAVRYHHALVAVVELEGSALPYYWVTVGDDDLPFTVAVEHTRLTGTADYGGRTIVYLGRYVAPDDRLLAMTDAQIADLFLNSASAVFSPRFRDPLAVHVFRAPAAQPIVTPMWGKLMPAMRTPLRGLVTANMAQIYPWDRGLNYSLELGERAAREVLSQLDRAAYGKHPERPDALWDQAEAWGEP